MRDVSRRRLLEAGTALGLAGAVPSGVVGDEGHSSDRHSPELEKYVQPLPVPEKRTPDGRHRGAPYHEVSVEQAEQSFHPDLPDTTIWGFDGQFPGPIIEGRRGRPLAVEFDNSGLPEEHLFEVDEGIDGTTTENYVGYDGPVPEVRSGTHFHGLNVPPESDGQAEMWTSPDGVEGPRHSRDVQVLPNGQERLTSSYHDHTRGISRLNAYAGLLGPYYVRSWTEDRLDLPEGEYDLPLVLADRTFDDDGSLHYPDEFVANFAGDTATVNGAAWPYLEVEPRRYRFRILNLSNGRTYGLGLEDADGAHDVPTIHQISPGHGFLEDVVSIGHHGDLESLTVSPFERAEVVVDFSDYAGQTFTVTNDAAFPYSGGGDHGDGGHDDGMDMGGSDGSSSDGSGTDGNESESAGMDGGMDGGMDSGDGGMGHGSGDHPELPEIMQIRVRERGGRHDWSTDPTELQLPSRSGPDPEDAATTRQISMEMVMGSQPSLHTLNGRRWGDDVAIEPELGSTEVWEVQNDSSHTHPLHLHLVSFEVVGRGPDGTEPPLPNERGGKDVVRVDPDETVRIAVEFGDYTGRYPFHCHVLEHEEHDMMRPFEVVAPDDDSDEHGRDHDGKRDWGDDSGWGRGRGHGWRRGRGRGRGRDDDRDWW